jgi:Reverse transcriptase (RNA-dependent DNA polymerase)
MDVKSAYLNGDLEETIFMDLSPRYVPPSSTGKVCRLKKSIYELKLLDSVIQSSTGNQGMTL